MRIDILTLFPDTLGDVLSESILGRAQERGFIRIEAHQIRDYTSNKQNQVDDYPYGGGRGAIMQADPIYRCWESVCDEAGGPVHTIYLSPCGHTFKQADAIRLSKLENLILVCAVLSSYTDLVRINRSSYACQVSERGTDNYITIGSLILQCLVQAFCQSQTLSQGGVHFPVSCNNILSHNLII